VPERSVALRHTRSMALSLARKFVDKSQKKKKKLGDFATAIAKPAVCAKVLFSYGALRTAGRINQLGGTLP
jgi:hypothetical protein